MIPPLGHIELYGLPIAAYFGMLTFACVVVTAAIGYSVLHGLYNIPFRWHPRMVAITFASAFVHISLVIWQFFF